MNDGRQFLSVRFCRTELTTRCGGRRAVAKFPSRAFGTELREVYRYLLRYLRYFQLFWGSVQEAQALSYRRVTARCVLSAVILPIATQQCRNYLYDKS